MSLTTRQQALYNDRADVWRFNPPAAGTDGKPGDTTFTKIASAITVGFFPRFPDMSTPQFFGRFQGDQLITADVLRLEPGQEIDTGYIVKLTTPGHPLENTFWEVLGDPQVRVSHGRRRANFKSVFIKRVREAPEGVS